MMVNRQHGGTKSINSSEKKVSNYFEGPSDCLTKDYPEVQNKWSECGELDILPTITQESVKRKLSNLQTNKAPGPNKILILSQDP